METLIEKLLRKNASNVELEVVGIQRIDIFDALSDICETVHSSCDSECPVYKLNNNEVPWDEDFLVCRCLKNGRAMAISIMLAQAHGVIT